MSKTLVITILSLALLKVSCGEDNKNTASDALNADKSNSTVPTVKPVTAAPIEQPQVSNKMEVLDFNVTQKVNGTNIVCILAQFAAEIQLSHLNSSDKSLKNFALSNASTVDRKSLKCLQDSAKLVININGNAGTLEIDFNHSKSNYHVNRIVVTLNKKTTDELFNLNDTDGLDANIDKTLFQVSDGKSYYCQSETTENLNVTKGDFKADLVLEKVKLDAFRHEEKPGFRDAQECNSDQKVDEMIPILVGAALAALVVIVLIAYFIGRSRSRRLAYQSV